MAIGTTQRLGALGLSVAVGQFQGIETLGVWAVAQALSLAVYGPLSALAQILIVTQERAPQALRAELAAANAIAARAIAVTFGLAALLTLVAVPLPRPELLAAVALYALGQTVFTLAASHLLVLRDAGRLRWLALHGLLVVGMSLAMAAVLPLWATAAAAGAALLGAAAAAVPPIWADLAGGRIARRAMWSRARPLLLGYALINPAVLVSMLLVGAHDSAAAAVYGIGNQVRSLFLFPLSLLLPVDLHRRVRGTQAPRWQRAGLLLAIFVLATAALLPVAPMRLFVTTAPTTAELQVVQWSLASVPLAAWGSLLWQQCMVDRRFAPALGLNLLWVAVLFGAFFALPHGHSDALAMARAQTIAFAAQWLAIIGLRRTRSP